MLFCFADNIACIHVSGSACSQPGYTMWTNKRDLERADRFQNGCDKVVIEVRVVQFWSEIILVISNQSHAARSFDFEIALHSVQLR